MTVADHDLLSLSVENVVVTWQETERNHSRKRCGVKGNLKQDARKSSPEKSSGGSHALWEFI